MGTATKVRDVTGWQGDVALFRLDPALDDGTALVLVSAVDLTPTINAMDGILGNGFRRSETMVFPATDDGVLADWGELAMVPYKSHADALEDLGYTVTS